MATMAEGARVRDRHRQVMETMASARSRFEAWQRSCDERMDQLQELSRSVSRDAQDESEQLKRQLQALNEQKSLKEQEVSSRQQQYESLKTMLDQVNEKKVYFMQRMELLKERREGRVHVAEESIRELEARVAQRQQKINAQKQAIRFYNEVLGIRAEFSREKEKKEKLSTIRVIFTKVNPKNPSQEFWCKISLDDHTNKYAMLDCVPYVKRSADLVDDLNISNELFEFMRVMRREFERLAEESELRSVRLKDFSTFQSVQ